MSSLPPSPTFFAKLRRSGRLARKELRETLRDRRTIITLVLMPILMYPLIGVTFQKFISAQLTSQAPPEYRLGYETRAAAESVAGFLQSARQLLDDQPEDQRQTFPVFQHLGPQTPDESFDLESLLRAGEIDLGVRPQHADRQTRQFEFVTESGSPRGREAERSLSELMLRLNETLMQRRLTQLDGTFQRPVTISRRVLTSAEPPAFSLASLVPLILILMTVTGAVYPAIDLTAGERERGTLEALISAPVPRHEILTAKYLAVLTVALLTAIANLTAMTATAYLTGLESLLFGRSGLSLLLMVKVFGVLAVFAAFFSAILLAVTSFARSFKEAQAYLIPVMLVSMAPGVMAMMPGLKLTYGLSLAPLVNLVLLTRDLFDASWETGPAVVALGSTLCYSVIGLRVAAGIFGADAVLAGSTGSWSEVWHRPAALSLRPGLAQVLGCLAVILPAFLLFGRWLSRWVETSMEVWLIGQILLTTSLFVGVPMVSSIWQRLPWRDAFHWRRPPGVSWIAAGLAGFSLWPFAYEALIFLLPTEQLQQLMDKFSELESRIRSIPFIVQLLVFALAPAVTEELFFRGFLLQGLRRDGKSWMAILASAVIFGAFHVFTQGFSFERFPPTTLLGVCLGWLCVRTGSVLPGMLLHVLHNGFLLTLSAQPEFWKSWGLDSEHQTHLPWSWLGAAAVMVITAWSLVRWGCSRPVTIALPSDPETE